MTSPVTRSFIMSAVLSVVLAFGVLPLAAQTAPKPAPKPAAPQTKTPPKTPARPPARPSAPAAAAPAAKPAEPPAPPKPVAQDLHMKTVYTTGPQKTESVLYRKGEHERFEFGEVVLLRQHDLKRTVQIMKAANTYMVIPDGGMPGGLPVPPQAAAPNAPPQKPGVVMVTTTITDTGERKTAFGLQARHVKTTIDKQPAPGACDPAKTHIEMD